jgi:uncharacterized protein YerC
MTIAERDIVANYLKKHQELTYQTIADYFQCSVSTIAHVVRVYDLHRQIGRPSKFRVPDELKNESR